MWAGATAPGKHGKKVNPVFPPSALHFADRQASRDLVLSSPLFPLPPSSPRGPSPPHPPPPTTGLTRLSPDVFCSHLAPLLVGFLSNFQGSFLPTRNHLSHSLPTPGGALCASLLSHFAPGVLRMVLQSAWMLGWAGAAGRVLTSCVLGKSGILREPLFPAR